MHATTILATFAAFAAFVAAGCSGDESSGEIAQPPLGDLSSLPVGPESARVDIAAPSFTNPTTGTNPLHPTSGLRSAVLLGLVDGKRFRAEITLLPETRVIDWNGQRVETTVSQYFATLDGRIHEVALDHYAQADDGSVWYFGEDVLNYEDGVVVDTEGTWFAGTDGPAAMIMPGKPEVGFVYRPENIPGVVFEEVDVETVGATVDGPRGPVDGAIVVRELHMDGTYESKTFAPGYGEFFTGAGGDFEALALGLPADALAEPLPSELATIRESAAAVFDAGGWKAIARELQTMRNAWAAYSARSAPPRLEAQMSNSLARLSTAVREQSAADAQQSALDIAQATLDLELQYRPAAMVDLARLELAARQLVRDLRGRDTGAIAGDLDVLDWVRDRFAHALASPTVSQIDLALGELRAAATAVDPDAASDAGRQLRATIAGFRH